MKIIKQETHTQYSKCLNHLRAAKSDCTNYMCKEKNKQKNPKKQRRKRKKKPKKLTSQCITPTRIKCMALYHFYFYINNCQLKLGVSDSRH